MCENACAAIVADRSVIHGYHNCYSRWLNKAEQEAKKWRWFNRHFKVCRAQRAAARVTISDWSTLGTGGGSAANI